MNASCRVWISCVAHSNESCHTGIIIAFNHMGSNQSYHISGVTQLIRKGDRSIWFRIIRIAFNTIYRALLQKRPMFLGSLLIECVKSLWFGINRIAFNAIYYICLYGSVCTYMYMHTYIYTGWIVSHLIRIIRKHMRILLNMCSYL